MSLVLEIMGNKESDSQTVLGQNPTGDGRLQPIVALSTTEAEYIAAIEAIKEAILVQHLDVRYHFLRDKATNGVEDVNKIGKKDNLADFGTKVVSIDKFVLCKDLLHINEA
ncbi:hypothetical protein M9H77_16765 [Catharanthus roseus]|uniref:Uncharacterized protein n=1 Tax=Catharanthus roseus TaxID=4058 RepID=A0ACC0B2M9_CATRO|nr:hypothetical protein M9H77_16765 [Catharanthus roseus]